MDSLSVKFKEVTPQNKNFKMLVGEEHYNHYENNAYENFTSELIYNHVQPGAIFVDIGAHYGYYSLLIGTKNSNNRVVAFEPSPFNYEMLLKNSELNSLKNIETYNMAASNKNETRDFIISSRSSQSGFYGSNLSKSIEKIQVRAVPLDDIINETSTTQIIIKIDVEGHEIAVLEGMTNLLKNTDNIELFIEFNPDSIALSNHQPEELLELIDNLGFSIYLIDDELRKTYKLKDLKKWKDYFGKGNYNKNYFNLICAKKGRSLSICIFSHSSQLAGAERGLLELATELIRDHQVLCTVVLPGAGPLKEKLEDVGASTLITDYYWWCDLTERLENEIYASYDRSMDSLVDQIDTIIKIDSDVILTNTIVIPWGALSAYILNKPHVWSVREFGELDHGLKFYLPFQGVLRLITDSTIVFANSDAVKKSLFSNVENVTTIYNYIEIPEKALLQDNINYFSRKDAVKLIISGNITASKGQMDAILAVKMLIARNRDVELLIVGTSVLDYLEKLKRLIHDEGIEPYVKLLSFQTNPYPIIDQADIVLLCSRNEAFGRVILEAMLLNKPVIGTRSGGVPELIVEGYNGFLYEPGNPDQLADKIEYFIENRDKLSEFGKNGYDYAKKNFTRETYGGAVYKKLLSLKNTTNGGVSSPTSTFATDLMVRTIRAKAAENRQMVQGMANLKDQIQVQNDQLNAANERLEVQNDQLNAANERLRVMDNELNGIKESLVWRLTTKFHYGLVERLLSTGTRRRKAYDLGLRGMRIIVNEGLGSFWYKLNDYRWSRKNWDKKKLSLPKLTLKTAGTSEDIPIIDKSVSVVIPTKNAGADFVYTLEKIKNQKGVKSIEIIVIDSGSGDETVSLAEKYGLKVYTIKPEEFNHGTTRNLGAEKASGDYILFTVQDAIPVSSYWLYDMLKTIENGENITAVTCRQLPKSNADLFACFSLWYHYRSLNFDKDQVSALDSKFDGLAPTDKRKYCGLENTCCLVRKEIFNQFKFNKLPYAEDLDLGQRLLKNGQRLAFLYSVAVIHSHNRDPLYFIKRSYIDNISLSTILEYTGENMGKPIDPKRTFSSILALYAILNTSVNDLSGIRLGENGCSAISRLKSAIDSNARKKYSELIRSSGRFKDLDELLGGIGKTLDTNGDMHNDGALRQYIGLLDHYGEYLGVYASLEDKNEEFIDSLYKMFAIIAGSTMASAYLSEIRINRNTSTLSALDAILSGGI